ncbi:lymphocyte antigen 75-like [Eriocheir sinensis]|uniref:lymphocyte antigen 75-like n=1 Tax=Eriocheir sinensis TaxID=95602 RepID=UPI0021C66A72|nr:lymphocyte antigen 75-like [Eriocheir sinensis]
MESLRLLFPLLLGLAAFTSVTLSKETTETVAPNVNPFTEGPCPSAYYVVGDRCVLVNPFVEGSWDEAWYYCSTLGADIMEINSMAQFLDVLNFLRDKGLDQHSYWLGARDVVEEGFWKWELTGEEVPMGTPFWSIDFDYGDNYFMEPVGMNYSNCLRLDHERYLYLDDKDCTSSNSFACQILL